MAKKYEVTKFVVDTDDSSKTKIGIKVTDENNEEFYIDKSLTTGSKTSDALMKEAYTAIENDVTEWSSKLENVGKVWNDEKKSFE